MFTLDTAIAEIDRTIAVIYERKISTVTKNCILEPLKKARAQLADAAAAAGFTVDKDNLTALDTSIAEKVFNKLISYQLALIDDLPCKAETLISEAIVVLSSVCLQEYLDNLDATKVYILNDAQQIVTHSTQIVKLA